MLKKEIIDTLKILGQSMLLLLLAPLAMLLNWHIFHAQWEISGIFEPIFVTLVLLFTVYSGVSIFQTEKRNNSLEYLLSLPLSIWKILFVKLVPRLVTILFLLVLGGFLSIFRSFVIDSIEMIILFLIAVFISLAVDSLINAMIGVLIINIILYYSSLIVSYLTIENHFLGSTEPIFWLSHLLPVLLVLLPMGIAFGLTLKNFDLKPLKWQTKPYLFIALPSIAALILFIMIHFKYYLLWIQKIG